MKLNVPIDKLDQLSRQEQMIELKKIDIIRLKAKVKYLSNLPKHYVEYWTSAIVALNNTIKEETLDIDELVRELERFKRTIHGEDQ
jgi:hypothetical protein